MNIYCELNKKFNSTTEDCGSIEAKIDNISENGNVGLGMFSSKRARILTIMSYGKA